MTSPVPKLKVFKLFSSDGVYIGDPELVASAEAQKQLMVERRKHGFAAPIVRAGHRYYTVYNPEEQLGVHPVHKDVLLFENEFTLKGPEQIKHSGIPMFYTAAGDKSMWPWSDIAPFYTSKDMLDYQLVLNYSEAMVKFLEFGGHIGQTVYAKEASVYFSFTVLEDSYGTIVGFKTADSYTLESGRNSYRIHLYPCVKIPGLISSTSKNSVTSWKYICIRDISKWRFQ